MVELLHNAVRPYAWGSRTAIATMLGRAVPAPHPEAELWMGAHPDDPSKVIGADGAERSLLDLVAEDPVGQLGAAGSARWGTRLPFLLKILAADEPVSLQAHPSAAQAEAGFAREEAAGIPREAPNRNYPDPTPKPELICALTELHALAGFRDPQRTVKLLRSLQTPGLEPYVELLAAQPNSDGLRALFTTWITLPQPALDRLEPELLDACVEEVRAHSPFELECRTILQLGELYPGDPGVLVSLLLNRIVLAPSDAIYMPAGNLHSYLQGTGVEILANSDNVLRGGLTPKHVDVPELLRILDFGYGDPVLRADRADRRWVYRTPAEEFQLTRIEWTTADGAEVRLAGGLPRIMVCTEGAVRVGGELTVRRGASVWVPASDPDLVLRSVDDAPAQAFVATVGTI